MSITVNRTAALTGHNAAIFALAATAPRQFLSGSGEGWIVRWDLDQPDLGRLAAQVEQQIFALAVLPSDPEQWVAGNMTGGLHWIDPQAGVAVKNVQHHRKGVFALIWATGFLWSAGGDGLLTRWDPHSRSAQDSLRLSHQSLRCLAWYPPRQELAVGASDGNIYLVDAQTLTLRHTLVGAHLPSVFCLHYAPGGDYLLSGGRDAHLRVWACANWTAVSAQPAHWYTLNSIAFHPAGHLFATASRDKTIKIWDAHNWQLLKVLDAIRYRGHVNSVNALLWLPGNELVSAGDDRSIMAWEIS